ncbi:hypothetical protein ACYJ1Y_09630 [Natrialbaceae archaeon A-gly3]
MTGTTDETGEIAQLYAFCSSVLADVPDEEADHPFYETIGWVLEGILEADTHGLGIDLEELSPGYSLTPSIHVPDGTEK